jgi:hypothetical protein
MQNLWTKKQCITLKHQKLWVLVTDIYAGYLRIYWFTEKIILDYGTGTIEHTL